MRGVEVRQAVSISNSNGSRDPFQCNDRVSSTAPERRAETPASNRFKCPSMEHGVGQRLSLKQWSRCYGIAKRIPLLGQEGTPCRQTISLKASLIGTGGVVSPE
jgi:hypothetical protein